MRKVIGIIVGLVIAIALIDLSWALVARWFPSPIDPSGPDAEMLAGYVIRMPLGGQLLVVVGWFVAGFAASFAALRISQWRPAGWIVGVLIVVLGIWNLTQLAQPLWMQAMSFVAPLIGCWLAERHFHRARPGDPLLN
jgi:MFS family permease